MAHEMRKLMEAANQLNEIDFPDNDMHDARKRAGYGEPLHDLLYQYMDKGLQGQPYVMYQHTEYEDFGNDDIRPVGARDVMFSSPEEARQHAEKHNMKYEGPNAEQQAQFDEYSEKFWRDDKEYHASQFEIRDDDGDLLASYSTWSDARDAMRDRYYMQDTFLRDGLTGEIILAYRNGDFIHHYPD